MKESLHKLLLKLKPGVPRKTHLFLAALLWTIVGLSLILRGSSWLQEERGAILLLPSIVLGTLKSLFILDKSAKQSIDRIQRLADGSCLGAVYSLKTWLLVLLMMSAGYIMRHLSMSLLIIGSLYVTVGWALFFSSRHGWIAWKNTN